MVERPLVAWNGGEAADEDIVLDGDTSDWCQFKAHANAGVQSTFDMNDYTSKLDVQKSRYTKEEAERIAAEIESAPRNLPATAMDDSGVRLAFAVRKDAVDIRVCLILGS